MDTEHFTNEAELLRVILWLIETRDPKSYKLIQSKSIRIVGSDPVEQAKILLEEYLAESRDPNIDQNLKYKTVYLEENGSYKMSKNVNFSSSFTVFEITEGWYLKQQDAFVIESGLGRGSIPYISEPESQQWYFQNGKPTINEMKITTSLWEAEKFSEEDIKLYEEGLKNNFSAGSFKDISATINIQSVQ